MTTILKIGWVGILGAFCVVEDNHGKIMMKKVGSEVMTSFASCLGEGGVEIVLGFDTGRCFNLGGQVLGGDHLL